jgi:hypothetical protein
MLGTPHLLGADVPPLGAILLTYSGSGTSPSATRDYQYIFRALGADVPPLGVTSGISEVQSRRTAISDCQYVRRMLRADIPPLGVAVVAQSGRTAIGDCLGCWEPLSLWCAIACGIVRFPWNCNGTSAN